MKKETDESVTGKNLDGDVVTLKQSKPFQLSLFHTYLPSTPQHSKTIELYDAIPKYFSSPKKMDELRHSGKFLDILERNFKHREEEYTVEITPARLKRKDGQQIEYYPTMREHLVEEALKKIATDPHHGVYLDDNLGVRFTLYQLQQELKNKGHSIKYSSLIESLTIGNKTNLSLLKISGEKKPLFNSAIFPMLIMTDRDAWLKNPKSTFCYVQFNSLVTQSLKHLTYRQHNYDTFMMYKKPLSQWFHKRLYHNYTQASLRNSYTIKNSTVVRDSGLVGCSGIIRRQIAEVEKTLNELKEQEIIRDYTTEKKYEGRKIVDAVHELKPSIKFIDEIVKANQQQREIEELAVAAGKIKVSYNRHNYTQINEVIE